MTHLEEVGMCYFEHMGGALKYALMSGYATAIFVAHAIVPDYFVFDGSSIINKLHKEFTDKFQHINNSHCSYS